ncbi:c-type cytochrome [Pseudaestuariivita sp.]|uniref:c-type cytochrome n=1 Tax=Pseudaestuariivita sp. TaxID=2211669 RepID=UPI0040583C20
MRRTICIAAVSLIAASALAHQGVTNPTVMARMELMSGVAAQTKVLGQMVKGQTAFDAAKADAAKIALVAHADGTAGAFAANESDPKSEALPVIWKDPAAFAAEVAKFQAAAQNLDTSSKEALSATFRTLGASCSSCHKAYRM